MSDITQETGLPHYLDAVKHNLGAPLPNFILLFDRTVKLLFTHSKYEHDSASLRMIVLAHSTSNAAIVLNVGGATAQVTPLLRHALECAMYAYTFHLDRTTYEAWSARETDIGKKNIARNRLQFKKIISGIEDRNPKLAEQIREHYEILLSYGAHPNVFQILPLLSTQLSDSEDKGDLFTAYLTDDEARRGNWFLFAAIYLILLETYKDVFPNEYLLLGMDAALRDPVFHFAGYAKVNDIA